MDTQPACLIQMTIERNTMTEQTEVDTLKHALKLAREDLWFLMMYTDCCSHYAERCASTAEFITKNLGDHKEFEPTLQTWLKGAENPAALAALTETRSTGMRPA